MLLSQLCLACRSASTNGTAQFCVIPQIHSRGGQSRASRNLRPTVTCHFAIPVLLFVFQCSIAFGRKSVCDGTDACSGGARTATETGTKGLAHPLCSVLVSALLSGPPKPNPSPSSSLVCFRINAQTTERRESPSPTKSQRANGSLSPLRPSSHPDIPMSFLFSLSFLVLLRPSSYSDIPMSFLSSLSFLVLRPWCLLGGSWRGRSG